MITFPNAKINIGLNIVEKRSDGYHNIQSIFYPIGLSDALEIIVPVNEPHPAEMHPKPGVEFHPSGIAIPGDPQTNLCIKAYQLIASDYNVPPIQLYLRKTIPIGAGLGGGSSDAAFFIQLLNKTLALGLSSGEQHKYARKLGSDCAFFLSNKPAYVEGVGDQFETIDVSLSGYQLLVIYPHLHIPTAMAYKGVKPNKTDDALLHFFKQPIETWKSTIKNDFESVIFEQHPLLSQIKQQLYDQGALYAAMSGSGSSLYGIFDASCQVNFPNPNNYFIYHQVLK